MMRSALIQTGLIWVERGFIRQFARNAGGIKAEKRSRCDRDYVIGDVNCQRDKAQTWYSQEARAVYNGNAATGEYQMAQMVNPGHSPKHRPGRFG